MVERPSDGEVLNELREALYLLEQMPAGSRIGSPWSEEQQSVEDAIVEARAAVVKQEKLVAIYGPNFVDTTCEDDFVDNYDETSYDIDGECI